VRPVNHNPATLLVGPSRHCHHTTANRLLLGSLVLLSPGTLEKVAAEQYAATAETHSAVVFFVGEHAYKLKKPVSLGFLDYSTREARVLACQRETELNRRFAPDVYLGVAEFQPPGGRPAEPLVAMRRMPADRRLATLVQVGADVDVALRQVARQLAAQHAASPRRDEITEQGSRDSLWARWRDNTADVRSRERIRSHGLDVEAVEALADRFLAGRLPLFDSRMRAGRIVDGHGDLLADDIFCLDDGPRILDCIEFADRLRWLDVLDDASFLAMDLDRLGRADLAERFVAWYAEFAGDAAPSSLRHHFVAYRAFVRAKVCRIRADQGQPTAIGEAVHFADQALRHMRAGAISLVLVGGLPGTGKSVLAGAIADRLGSVVLNSDRTRKELAGIAPEDSAAAPFEAGIYDRQWTERTYGELLSRASGLLGLGESVIIDASWTSAEQRAAAAALADNCHADLVQLRCTAPPELAARRLRERTGDVSDATWDVAEQMSLGQAPWPDSVPVDASEPGSGGPSERALSLALATIRPHGPEHAWRPARPNMLPG
jgi:uncharacterized protein